MAVCNWRTRGCIPVQRALDIERATNGVVTREELRPDIFGPNPQAQSITGQDHRVAERRSSTNRRVTTRRKLSPGTGI